MKTIIESQINGKVKELYSREGVWYIDDSPEYACFHKELEEYKRLAGAVCGDLLLEIGAGRGRVLKEFVDKYRKIIAIDISEAMINNLKNRRLRNVYIVQADAQNLPLKNNMFDLVLAPAVIGHCASSLKLVLEMKRVLKSRGTGIVSTTANSLSIPGLFGQLKSFLEHKSLYRNPLLLKQGYCRDTYFFIRKNLIKAGLKLRDVSGTGILPSFISVHAGAIEKLSRFTPIKYFCRVIIVSFKK
jgi:ubiquinone/menaquinone biosynthesis C-methylase UbiE